MKRSVKKQKEVYISVFFCPKHLEMFFLFFSCVYIRNTEYENKLSIMYKNVVKINEV